MSGHLHITPGPDVVTATGREVSAVHCKTCHRKTVHVEVVLTDSEPGYYQPHMALQCKRCRTVRTWVQPR